MSGELTLSEAKCIFVDPASFGINPTDAPVTKIDKLHVACETARYNFVAAAVLCGQLLQQQKKDCGHGNFEKWVEQNCRFTPRHARRYIAAAKEAAHRSSRDDKSDTACPISSLRSLIAGDQPKPVKDPDAEPARKYSAKEHAKLIASAVVKADVDARAEVEAKYAALRRELTEAREMIERLIDERDAAIRKRDELRERFLGKSSEELPTPSVLKAEFLPLIPIEPKKSRKRRPS